MSDDSDERTERLKNRFSKNSDAGPNTEQAENTDTTPKTQKPSKTGQTENTTEAYEASKTDITTETHEVSQTRQTDDASEVAMTGETQSLTETDKQSKASKTPSMDGVDQASMADETPVRQQKTKLLYLPEEFLNELELAFDELNIKYKREHGTELQKNRDFYPKLLEIGLNELGEVREQDLAELEETLNL